ncbi:MAG: hypothetical protein OXT71_18875 [Acidobacteriota bacterium]|nr:hypothetical protein [Acidobacteriota bacterium]
MSRNQMGPEGVADYFVNYLFNNYQGARHVRRVASWVGLIVLAVDKVGNSWWRRHTRQLGFTFQDCKFKVKYDHTIGSRGGIQVIEILPGRGEPEGGIVTSITSLREAEQFYLHAEKILRKLVQQKTNRP